MKLKSIFFITIIACFSLFSCEEKAQSSAVCGVENPLEDLVFLKEAKNTIDRIDCAGKSTIIKYTYKSEIVFEINICSQIADGQTLVYNCAGEIVCTFGGIAGVNTCPDYEETKTNEVILYGN
jgi:uncharacterized lipoprotein YehR (DUF1307 family)